MFELVWENGQISVQGQSSRARKSPNCKTLPPHCLPSHTPLGGHANDNNATITRMGKCGSLGAELNEIRRVVPSGEVYFSEEEVDMVMPWLNYEMDHPLQQGYSSDFFHELSGVNMNEPSASNSFSLLVRRNSCSKVSRDTHKNTPFASVRSKLVDIAENNTNNVPSPSSGFSSLKMEKHGPVVCSNSSTMMNFSHFAKPAAIVKANLQNIGLKSRPGSVGIKIKGAAATVGVTNPAESTKVEVSGECPKISVTQIHQVTEPKPLEQDGAVSTKCDPSRKDVSKIDETSNLVGESGNKGKEAVEKHVEPAVVSSSVCSGNGAERGLKDPNQNLKRRRTDTEDFESQSEVSFLELHCFMLMLLSYLFYGIPLY